MMMSQEFVLYSFYVYLCVFAHLRTSLLVCIFSYSFLFTRVWPLDTRPREELPLVKFNSVITFSQRLIRLSTRWQSLGTHAWSHCFSCFSSLLHFYRLETSWCFPNFLLVSPVLDFEAATNGIAEESRSELLLVQLDMARSTTAKAQRRISLILLE